VRNQAGNADTEELRQAFVHYRVLFAELLGASDAAAVAMEAVRA
jgi:hypothetical protein